MKTAIIIPALLLLGAPITFSAVPQTSPSAEVCTPVQAENNLTVIIEHLNKLTKLLKQSRQKKAISLNKQLRKIEQYVNSPKAENAHNLLLEGFSFPGKDDETPKLATKAKSAMHALEQFRKESARFIRHCNKHFTSCDKLGQDENNDAIWDVLNCAESDYTTLYHTLHADAESIPEWEAYLEN